MIFSILFILGLSAQSYTNYAYLRFTGGRDSGIKKQVQRTSDSYAFPFQLRDKGTHEPKVLFEDNACDATLVYKKGKWTITIYSAE